MMHKILCLFGFLFSTFTFSLAQQSAPSSVIKHRIDKLAKLGTVLYFAAHPDDENTRLIAWLANDQHYRTAYLSLTRGDGGQNLLGTEQGINLGLIRTQELLAARSIDKGEQYFSSAYDFGFSKTHQETFSFWNSEETLKEAVFIIRKLQPDVIITRFPPDTRGGHGHHQASAIIAKQAYELAADPNSFPEQLKTVKPWQAKRLVWNTANFGGQNNTNEQQLIIQLTDYNPLLGYSYGEIAALSRSQHKSQGFGASANRGTSTEYFEHVAGEKATQSLFDGQQTNWERLKEPTTQVEEKIKLIQKEFNADNPALSIPELVKLHALISGLKPGNYTNQKLKEVEEIIVQSAGLVTESNTAHGTYVVGEPVELSNEIIVRAPQVKVRLLSIDDHLINEDLPHNETKKYSAKKTYTHWTQPFWLENPHSLGKFSIDETHFGLAENPDNPKSTFKLEIAGLPITVETPTAYKYVDPVDGEIHQPIVVTPKFSGQLENNNVLLKNGEKQSVSLRIKNQTKQPAVAKLTFEGLDGFEIALDEQGKDIALKAGEEITKTLLISGPQNSKKATIKILVNGEPLYFNKHIAYKHIPEITWFENLSIHANALDLINPVKKIAFIPGAGDLVSSSLANIGMQVDQLSENQITQQNLQQYDAVVVGVRAYNVNKQVSQWLPKLFSYVENGGTVLVQYNVNSRLETEQLGPYPFIITRDRVTQEDSPVQLLLPQDPALNYPNKITQADFEDWVQERGLYFAGNVDSHYRTPLALADQNEQTNAGSLLISNYGKGKFVYTSLSFFRQLPAGIPGAYRLFVNLLAKEEK